MKNRHITKILDQTDFSRLSAADSAEISEHIAYCPKCRAAFQSARIASILMKEAAASTESLLPTPYFQAKVLNAWREKQSVPKPFAVFRRWWQASAALVLVMFLTAVGLMTISLIASKSAVVGNLNTDSESDLYSAETVILNEKTPHSLTNEQVFEVLYDGK